MMKSDGIKDWISMLNDKTYFKNNSNGKQFSRQKSSS